MNYCTKVPLQSLLSAFGWRQCKSTRLPEKQKGESSPLFSQ